MDREDPLACWRLFTYTALLNESQYLSRPVKQITMALNGTRDCTSIDGTTMLTTPESQQPSYPTLIGIDNRSPRTGTSITPVLQRQDSSSPSAGLNHHELVRQLIKASLPDHGDLKTLHFSLAQIKGDVSKALEIVKSTIDMVLSVVSAC